MDIKLSQGESRLKTWSFFTTETKTKGEEEFVTDNALIVTNKRVILESTKHSKKASAVARQELALDSVKGVQTSYEYSKGSSLRLLGLIFILISLAVLLVDRFVNLNLPLPVKIVFIVILVLGIIFLFIKKDSAITFNLAIFTTVNLDSSINISTSLIGEDKATRVIKDLMLDEVMAQEIVDEIGALIVV